MDYQKLSTLSTYGYSLPAGLAAQEPLLNRSDSRMMVVSRKSGLIEDKLVCEFPLFLRSGDCLVINNTKVLPARLFGTRHQTGGEWEGLFLSENSDGSWQIINKTRGTMRPDDLVELFDSRGVNCAKIKFLAKSADGTWSVKPDILGSASEILESIGSVPIPPYIRRGKMNANDKERYQTVYASQPGAAAAPTAGLHFDSQMLAAIKLRGIEVVEVTLHVGLGTFQPVKVENLDEHIMHSEWCRLTESAASTINGCKKDGGRIVAVGTTSVRVIESATDIVTGKIRAVEGKTSLFIKPPYWFRNIDMLLTNFHFPKSTLLILVCAFGGYDLIRKAYAEAINKNYRFFSYGDAMLIK
jgi:S-adenosylmethionine:tRNA ribosyltransferase-isomerase